ncbi:MAG TPA: T9SS type B sorting domain-containing protein, partial [Chitinophagaceae bacterium]|nr:T9SS type B sorting domain-containing protein [Chitinophagaceae bacterium]
NSGAIDLTVTGGTGPYTFAWSNSATTEDIIGLAAGTYTVTVTDVNGCTQNGSFDVGQINNTITITPTVVNTICTADNGSISLVISGGDAPYTFLWNTGATTQDLSGLAAGTYTVTVTDVNGCTQNGSFDVIQDNSNITLSSSVTNAICTSATGAIDLTVSGGTAPYTYLWSNGATTEDVTGLVTGNYTVTVTDANGCTQNATINVGQNNNTITITPTINPTICIANNGSITLVVTGGTAPYTYVWNTGATTKDISGLAAGTYTVTVTDVNGCTQNGSFDVIQDNSTITLSSSVTNAICTSATGAIDLTVSGGTAPYTYLWSNGATTEDVTGLVTGNYTVTVTDANGCTQNVSISVGQDMNTITITPTIINTICTANSGSIDLVVTGGNAPYSYLWNTGAVTQNINGLDAGTYSVTVTDANGCTQMGSYTVGQDIDAITITALITNTICTSSSGSIELTINGGTAPYSFVWNNGATVQNINGLDAGTFTVTVTDANGCTQNGSFIVDQDNLSITVTGAVTKTICAFSTGAIDLTINGGNAPYTFNWNNGATTQNIAGLDAGNYTVTVTDVNGCSQTISETVETILPLADDPADLSTCPGYVLPALTNGAYFSSPGAVGPIPAGTVINTPQTIYVYGETGTTPNCFVENSFVITIYPKPNPPTVTTTQPDCNNATGTITVTLPFGPGYTFSLDGLTFTNTTGVFTGLVSGIYTVSAKSSDGCISNDRLVVINPEPATVTAPVVSTSSTPCVTNSGVITVNSPVGTGITYSIDGSDYSNTSGVFSGLGAGVYNVTAKSIDNCISPVTVTTLIFTGGVHTTSTTDTSICTYQLPFNWNGNSYNATGIYTVTLPNATGCDSIINLNLTVIPVTTSATNITICSNQLPYNWNGNSFNAAGSYPVTLQNAAGCDSIATLNLTVISTSGSITTRIICSDQLPFTWNGNNYTTSGIYTFTTTNNAGCDSIATLDLTVNSTSTSATNTIACTNQLPFIWNGNAYNTSGTYSVTLSNGAGCDSIAILNLTVNPTSTSTTNIAICSNQLPFVWNANNYNTSGTYSVTLQNAGGCDSVATINLTVNDTTASTTNSTICSNDLPYNWNGNSYSAAGTYTVTLVNTNGCDSVATLNLTVNRSPLLVVNNPARVCAPATVDLTAPAITAGSDPGLTFTYWMDQAATIPLVNPDAVAVSGTYYIKSSVVNDCASTRPVEVKVDVVPKIAGIRYPTLTTQANTPLQLSARNLGVGYNWTPPAGLNFNSIINPVFNYDREVEYKVNILTDNGCPIVDTLLVRISAPQAALPTSDLFVPKAWSPNNDGHNDRLYPLTVNIRELKYFRIFNRWGQLVFETNTIGAGWDGMFKGQKQVIDVYTWTAEAIGMDGKTIKRTGNSALIR